MFNSQHPFIRLFGEKHFESKVTSSRAQPGEPVKGPESGTHICLFIPTEENTFVNNCTETKSMEWFAIHNLIQFCIPMISTRLILATLSNLRPPRHRMYYSFMSLEVKSTQHCAKAKIFESDFGFENAIVTTELPRIRCTQHVTCVKYSRMYTLNEGPLFLF